ncbi:ubiquitin recognition factor in ER-associated degradation protein 1-like [Bacillus rossius redtenbacheri]|uniref:ubiquitin recognition factor in ER-associated degradation protein 1-like n=1 Tax=Bacillus rossius redtenbacheri TaxID=93214 RepID=UPI002FDD7728
MSFLAFGLGIFTEDYVCYSASSQEGGRRLDVEDGGKIIMPSSALAKLSQLDIHYPMLFKLSNIISNHSTHSGVLEFVANEGHVYLPKWIMRNNLQLDEGDPIRVLLVTLPIATFARFQPLSVDFLDISNPKAVLESHLRRHACLTMDDVLTIHYNQKLYDLRVLETQPGTAVSIIECDMNVDFAPPVGYKERVPEQQLAPDQGSQQCLTAFVPFLTPGFRIDGKKSKLSLQNSLSSQESTKFCKVVPNYGFKIGSLRFVRGTSSKNIKGDVKKSFQPFSGQGRSLQQLSLAGTSEEDLHDPR